MGWGLRDFYVILIKYINIFSMIIFFNEIIFSILQIFQYNNNVSEIFHEIGLHKPDVDETWYDHNYVTRRFTAFYSRHNDMFETSCFFVYKNFSDRKKVVSG